MQTISMLTFASTEKDQIVSAVYKLQLALLEGIENEKQLCAAGSLMSRSDYEDVVIERSTANVCGYPLCSNSLPSEHPRKGRYRISLKEHKVYDLHETYMYCSSSCLITNRVFADSLQEKRCSVLDVENINEVLRSFKNLSWNSVEDLGKDGDLGLSELKIQGKTEARGGEVSLEEWIGPSGAIEGYLPQKDRNFEPLQSNSNEEGSIVSDTKFCKDKGSVVTEVGFKSSVILDEKCTGATNDVGAGSFSKYSMPHLCSSSQDEVEFKRAIAPDDKCSVSEVLPEASDRASNVRKPTVKKKAKTMFSDMDFMSNIITQDEYSISKTFPPEKPASVPKSKEFNGEVKVKNTKNELTTFAPMQNDKLMNSTNLKNVHGVEIVNGSSGSGNITADRSKSSVDVDSVEEMHTGKTIRSSKVSARSSLKSSGSKKESRTVKGADEKSSGSSRSCCEIKDVETTTKDSKTSGSAETYDESGSQRFVSAETCALALSQAAVTVASGQSDVTDAVMQCVDIFHFEKPSHVSFEKLSCVFWAFYCKYLIVTSVSEAGIILLPRPNENESKSESRYLNEVNNTETEPAPVRWPKKAGFPNTDLFVSEGSWFDASPEGFSLTLSVFATMWNVLFTWVTSSSLAFIYGKDESFHEGYMSVNGREYPQKIVLSDGRSSEIKRTLAGCLVLALPAVNAELKLPTTISNLEKGLGRLLDTMSFVDALPAFKVKQWQVITLLFIDALSICRIPGLSPHLISKRMLIPKILDGSQISSQEYEIMKNFVIPLGRVPQFSMQNGG